MFIKQDDDLKTYLIEQLGVDADVLPAVLELWLAAMNVFGERDDAAAWFTVRAMGLAARPVDVLRQPGGLETCRTFLMRVHHGVYC